MKLQRKKSVSFCHRWEAHKTSKHFCYNFWLSLPSSEGLLWSRTLLIHSTHALKCMHEC